jgi:hypothetical protein
MESTNELKFILYMMISSIYSADKKFHIWAKKKYKKIKKFNLKEKIETILSVSVYIDADTRRRKIERKILVSRSRI